MSIAYREIQQHLRRRTARPPAGGADLPPGPAAPDFADRAVAVLELTGQREELALACRWLEADDRPLLALWWQEAAGRLTRAELAAALSVSTAHAAVRLHRLRRRLDAARALVRALRATPRCPALAAVLEGWDGSTAPVWRKRLTRHLRDCPRCRTHHEGLVTPERLLFGVGLVPVPVVLAEVVRSGFHGGATAAHLVSPPAHGVPLLHHASLKTAAAVTSGALVLGGLTWAVHVSVRPDDGHRAPRAQSDPSGTRAPYGTGAPRPGDTEAARRPAPAYGVTSATVYVSPAGSDRGDGSRAHPYGTLSAAVRAVRPGDTIAVRGGVYRPTEPVVIETSGTARDRITLSNYRGEKPVFDLSGLPEGKWGVTQRADHWTVQGLEFMGSASHAYACLSCRHDVFRRLSLHGNKRSGLTLRGSGTIANQVLDSDFFDNHDDTASGGAGIGLAVKFGSGAGNVVRRCRSYHNANDGFDFGEFTSPVTVEDNWSFGNGVNRWNTTTWKGGGDGFTFGGGDTPVAVAHVVRSNAAWDNRGAGFTDENNPGRLRLTHNTAYRNGATGFSLPTAAAVLHDNVAVGNGRDTVLGDATDAARNSWQDARPATGSLFLSVRPATAEAARPPGGALPGTSFLRTRDGRGADMR
ncbi:hypothetical protein ACFV6E_40540 [Streptomyces sp. NPDC059785]|uniref:right-handed parallel beta-helix repeat-containing protein n=1 Tax=Streptomyces sp. NPDC059785 TaxID=3346945 RepID=UPI0036537149